ncbi:MAG: proton-conducting transporter membrane subunit [Candidatus Roizmanbacteria bacterium]
MLLIQSLIFGAIFLFICGALSGIVLYKKQKIAHILGSGFAIIASAFALIASLIGMISKTDIRFSFIGGEVILPVTMKIDSLAFFYILVISLIGLLASLYGYRYMKHYMRDYNLGVFSFFYNLFLLSMILVVTASNIIYFLFVWELMSLFSLFLVVFEYKNYDTVRAGIVYFILTHVATAFITAGFFILYTSSGSIYFIDIQSSMVSIPSMLKNIVFVCFLIGFGTKAGIIPIHIWLPRAHSVAPSHVSSLMSGVMIKLGIFMMIRMFFDVMPTPLLWWGIVILLLGSASSILGVLYALAEHDIKRLLAFHSIENIGIILLGMGSSLIFASLGQFVLMHLCLVASLFHTLNHAVFKSLLFLSAGSVISETHTRNIEEYGGLIKRMPYTALFFLIASIAISGLPPFNGFASEWITYQGLFQGILNQTLGIKVVFIIAITSLAFTGGLASACFVKVFGITFLARPRSKESKEAHESGWQMIIPMGILAFFCLIFGIGATYITGFLADVVDKISPINSGSELWTTDMGVYLTQSNATFYNPLFVFFAILIAIAITYGLVHLISGKNREIKDITWNCGFEYMTPRGEITATGFARSIILIFKGIFRPTKQSSIEYVDANSHNKYLAKSKTVVLNTMNVYEAYFYRPVDRGLRMISKRFKSLQTGNINAYLLYIFITLICVLIWVRYS